MGSYFIIDRRLNPKGKSLANRQRFIRRTKAQIRKALRDSLAKRKISDSGTGEFSGIRFPSPGPGSISFFRRKLLSGWPGSTRLSPALRAASLTESVPTRFS